MFSFAARNVMHIVVYSLMWWATLTYILTYLLTDIFTYIHTYTHTYKRVHSHFGSRPYYLPSRAGGAWGKMLATLGSRIPL